MKEGSVHNQRLICTSQLKPSSYSQCGKLCLLYLFVYDFDSIFQFLRLSVSSNTRFSSGIVAILFLWPGINWYFIFEQSPFGKFKR